MIELIFVLMVAGLNRLRGSDIPFTSKPYTSTATGLVVAGYAMLEGYTLATAGWVFLAVTLGMWFWAIFGWGDYWDGSNEENDEVGIIDWLVGKAYQPGYYNDLISMTLRGLFGYPLFIMLALAIGSWWPLLIGLGMGLQGLCYTPLNRIGKYHIIISEWLFGAVIGVLLVASI